MNTLKELIVILQVAIGPVILISGVGLLLLNMTNRFGRIIDRSRILSQQLRAGDADSRQKALAQVQILTRRAILMRRALTLACMSALFAALLVIALFLLVLFGLEVAWAIILLFSACMLSLIGALISFLQDIHESLLALKMELSELPVAEI